jgi:transcriptional regulator with AAA-type ATPase domain
MDHTREVPMGNRNDKNSLQGNIAELGNNVYQYGTQNQGEKVRQNDRGNSPLCWKRV